MTRLAHKVRPDVEGVQVVHTPGQSLSVSDTTPDWYEEACRSGFIRLSSSGISFSVVAVWTPDEVLYAYAGDWIVWENSVLAVVNEIEFDYLYEVRKEEN
jgi:hypothetical protein